MSGPTEIPRLKQSGSDMPSVHPGVTSPPRYDYLDAVRAFALLLGVVFHAGLSFLPFPIGWAVMDVSTSPVVAIGIVVSHAFRMELFFLIAGFFSRMSFHRHGARAFCGTRLVRLVIPLVVGWFLLRPLLVSGWIMGHASVRGEVDIAAALKGGFASLAATPPSGFFAGTHLWFLYYLILATMGLLAIRAVLSRAGRAKARISRWADAALARLASTRGSLLVLVLPTAVLLGLMRGWGMDTPDQTLRPHLPVLLVYGGFFCFGWLLHRNDRLIPELARLTVARWLVAGVAIVVTLVLSGVERDWGHPNRTGARVAHAVSYAVMMWSLVFLTLGVFQRTVRAGHRVVRYLADASYWLYLVHLPIVVWLQVAVAKWPWPWLAKLAGISVVTIACGLLSYDLFVRSTFVARILNGRRRPRALVLRARRTPAAVAVSPSGVAKN